MNGEAVANFLDAHNLFASLNCYNNNIIEGAPRAFGTGTSEATGC